MTTYYKTQGFTFKKEDRLEADRIFSIFTKDFGKVEIFSKAIRKITSKLRGGIEIFSLSEIEFIQGESRKTLTGTLCIEKFKNINQAPEKFEIAHKISNLIDCFIKGQEKDQGIFDLIIDTFEKLNSFDNKHSMYSGYQLIYYYFFWSFVSVLGYRPELLKCAVCQKKLNPYNLYFSSEEGGIICKNCYILKRDSLEVTSDFVKVLRLILKKDWKTLSRLKIENSNQKLLEKVSSDYHNYLLSIF